MHLFRLVPGVGLNTSPLYWTETELETIIIFVKKVYFSYFLFKAYYL